MTTRVFDVTVEGRTYRVQVEEVAPALPARTAAPCATPPVDAPARAPVLAGGPAAGTVNAPMACTVVAVKVAPGDCVATGDTLLVIEAMKMESPVLAPVAGRVQAVHVCAGDKVEACQVLVELA